MRSYENLLLPVDEWYITSTLHLDERGRFRYHEEWSCYCGSVDGEAEGNWRLTDGAVVLETLRIEGTLRIGFIEGQKYEARRDMDSLDFGNGFIMTERRGSEVK